MGGTIRTSAAHCAAEGEQDNKNNGNMPDSLLAVCCKAVPVRVSYTHHASNTSGVLNVLIIAISLGRVDLAYSYYLLCTPASMSSINKQGSVSLLAAIDRARARDISA